MVIDYEFILENSKAHWKTNQHENESSRHYLHYSMICVYTRKMSYIVCLIVFFFLLLFVCLVFCLFRDAHMACGGSQARDLIRSTAAGLRQSHSNAGSEPHLRSTPQLKQHRILNPLSEARDGNCNLIVPSRIRFCCTMTGTPRYVF